MTTPAALFTSLALATLALVATPAHADTVRDHRKARPVQTQTVRDHRRPTTVPVAPPVRTRPVIQPRTYAYDGGTFYGANARYHDRSERVWIPGSWQWHGDQQVWVEGRWVEARPGLTDPGPSWVHPRDRWTRAPEDWLRN